MVPIESLAAQDVIFHSWGLSFYLEKNAMICYASKSHGFVYPTYPYFCGTWQPCRAGRPLGGQHGIQGGHVCQGLGRQSQEDEEEHVDPQTSPQEKLRCRVCQALIILYHTHYRCFCFATYFKAQKNVKSRSDVAQLKSYKSTRLMSPSNVLERSINKLFR